MEKEFYDPEEMGFPPYVEEVNPLPDVETDFNFEEHKEEIYRRNIELAAENMNAQRVMYPENMDAEEIYPQGRAEVETVPQKNNGAANVRKRKIITILACAAMAVIVAVTAFSLGRSELVPDININAEALSRADGRAKNACTAAIAGLTQLYIDGAEVGGYSFENSGTVFIFGDTEKNMAEELGNSFSGYVYGVFYDFYDVEYALWSAEPIPEEYRRKLTEEEREELARKGIIIGCYPSE